MTFSSFPDSSHLYFVTATVCGCKPLFREPVLAKGVLDCLSWLRRERRMLLFAFVLMPSHLHAILQPLDRTVGDLLQDFGSYTAHRLLTELRRLGWSRMLDGFQALRRDSRHSHSVWQDIQAKNIHSRAFLKQKLEYVHNNPLRSKRLELRVRADYVLSSASFFDYGLPCVIPLDDVRAWL